MKCLLFKSQPLLLYPQIFSVQSQGIIPRMKIVCFQLRKMISDNHHPPNMPKISGLGII